MANRTHILAATTSAVAWDFFEGDDFRVPRIAINLATAPTTAGLLTVSVDSVRGAAYDHVVRTVNPVGQTSIVIEGLYGFVNGDHILVEYANADGVSITGVAVAEIVPINPNYASDLVVGDGLVRSRAANYRRYYHINLGSASPGASGATWTYASANQLSGWLLDADTEYLNGHVDLHGDWDGTSKPVIELLFTVVDNNTTGDPTDTLDLEVIARYAQPDIAIRTQTVTCENVVGAAAQYSVWKCEIELDPLATDNPLAIGDAISLRIRVLGTGDLTQAVINSISFWYPITHIGIESADV